MSMVSRMSHDIRDTYVTWSSPKVFSVEAIAIAVVAAVKVIAIVANLHDVNSAVTRRPHGEGLNCYDHHNNNLHGVAVNSRAEIRTMLKCWN